MKKFSALLLTFTFLIMLPLILLADSSIVVPDGDPLVALLNLITNFKALGPMGAASVVIVLVVQSFKKFLPDFKYLKLVVVFGGISYGFVQALVSGLSLGSAAVFVLLTSGGAVAIYEVLKSPLNAVFGVQR